MEGVMDQEASEESGSNRMSDYCKKQKNRAMDVTKSKEQWISRWIRE
jgi:hypothetical protein